MKNYFSPFLLVLCFSLFSCNQTKKFGIGGKENDENTVIIGDNNSISIPENKKINIGNRL